MTALQIIALVWTILSSIGAARAGQKFSGSRADRAYLKEQGVNGPMEIMAKAWVIADLFRIIAFSLFASLGLIAFITDGYVGRWVIRISIFGALLLWIAHGEIMGRARRDVMRYHSGSPGDRRKSSR